MAITFGAVSSGIDTSQSASDKNLGNILAGLSGQCIVAFMTTASVANPSIAISGGGVTWTFQGRDENWWGNLKGQALNTGIGTVDGSSVHITSNNANTVYMWSIAAFNGVDPSPIVQFVRGSASLTPYVATLAAFGAAGNVAWGGAGTNAVTTTTKGANFTAIDSNGTFRNVAFDFNLITEYELANDTNVTASDDGEARGLMYGLEIKAAAAAAGSVGRLYILGQGMGMR